MGFKWSFPKKTFFLFLDNEKQPNLRLFPLCPIKPNCKGGGASHIDDIWTNSSTLKNKIIFEKMYEVL